MSRPRKPRPNPTDEIVAVWIDPGTRLPDWRPSVETARAYGERVRAEGLVVNRGIASYAATASRDRFARCGTSEIFRDLAAVEEWRRANGVGPVSPRPERSATVLEETESSGV